MTRAVSLTGALCALCTLCTTGATQTPGAGSAAGSAATPVRHVQHVRCARDTYTLDMNAWGEVTLLSILAQFPMSGDCMLDCEWTVESADPSMNLEVYIPTVYAVGDTPVLSMRVPHAVPRFGVAFNGTQAPVFAGSTIPGRVVVAGPVYLRIITTACADWRAIVNVFPTNQTQGTPTAPPPAKAPTALPSRYPAHQEKTDWVMLVVFPIGVAVGTIICYCWIAIGIMRGLTNTGRR